METTILSTPCPRLLIAGTGGDSGKTLITLGIISACRHRGITVAPFKKGPDYIDPAWLTLAAGRATRNLDTWLMGIDAARRSFKRHALPDGLNLIEGNRGLYDGEDALGSHSTAELAKLLKTPVVLILPVVKITRTAAAVALGMKTLDPEVPLVGIILNQAATSRQESIVRRAIEESVGLPVLGAVPRLKDANLLPGRHLGLVTPEEHKNALKSVEKAGEVVQDALDIDKLLGIARQAEPWSLEPPLTEPAPVDGKGLRIGWLHSPAFTFYYPENLEALAQTGAELIPIDPVQAARLPALDALYIGGGFPETQAVELSGNRSFKESLKQACLEGFPVWAECGGLMFLSRSLCWRGEKYPMTGILPVDIELSAKPQGHGYMEVEVDRDNPFLRRGMRLRGHEFHYSFITDHYQLNTAFKVVRGVGLGQGQDGIINNNVLASYIHIHALSSPQWVEGIIRAARNYWTDKRQESRPPPS